MNVFKMTAVELVELFGSATEAIEQLGIAATEQSVPYADYEELESELYGLE